MKLIEHPLQLLSDPLPKSSILVLSVLGKCKEILIAFLMYWNICEFNDHSVGLILNLLKRPANVFLIHVMRVATRTILFSLMPDSTNNNSADIIALIWFHFVCWCIVLFLYCLIVPVPICFSTEVESVLPIILKLVINCFYVLSFHLVWIWSITVDYSWDQFRYIYSRSPSQWAWIT